MIKFKKNEINSALVILSANYKIGDEVKTIGLLHEEITLGLKRRLQEMQAELVTLWNKYQGQTNEVNETCKDDPEKLKAELKILDEEEVELNAQKVSLAMIEEIKTTNNYDFVIIKKFAE